MSTIPKCHCGDICLSKEAFKGENRGRWYWKCRTNGCRFFSWNIPDGTVYTPIIHKPVESNKKRMDNFEPCANHSINLNRRDPAPFAYPELECPLVARKSRLSNPYRNKLRAAISSKTIVDMALCSNTDICIKADTRRRYIQTLLNTLPHFTISDQETQPMVVWNASMEMWVFSADQHSYKLVWDLMKKHRGTFEVSGVPTAVLRVLPIKSPYLYGGGGDVYGSTNHSNDEDEDNDNPLHWMGSWFEQEVITGSNLWKSMTLDQRSKMKKGVKLGGNIFFKESLGGAKCLQALGVAYVHREKWPVVIVCHPDSSMVWKKLIQDMLPYKSRDICLLDPLPYYNGKLGLSDKPKAVQSRIYRRRKRELLRQQQLNQQDGVASASASAFSPSLITSTSTSSLTTVSPPLSPFSPKDGAHLKALQQQTGPSDDESWYIDMSNDSGDPVNPRRKSSSTNNANILPPAKVSPLPISKAPSNSPSNISAIGRKRPHSALIDEKKGVGNYSSVDGFDWPTNINHSDDDDDDNNDNGNDDGNDSNMQDTTLNTVDGSINGDLDNEEGEAFNQAIINSAELFIISYQRAKSRLRSLGKKFKVVIFDDCHELGNTMLPTHQAAVQRLINGTAKTIMVSDMELVSSPMKAYPFLRLLKPNIFIDFKYFGHRYCGAKHQVFGWQYSDASNTEELQFLLDKILLVR